MSVTTITVKASDNEFKRWTKAAKKQRIDRNPSRNNWIRHHLNKMADEVLDDKGSK